MIELKKETLPQTVLHQLYKQTALQSNFGIIMLSLVNNKPCQLSLKDMLQEFLQFREETLTRQYNYELAEKQERLHLVEGLLIALGKIKKVINILSNSADGTSARQTLQTQLKISEVQANSILAMPLRRVTGLEKQKLEDEGQELEERIAQLKTLLQERKELLKALKKELRSLKRRFVDPRRTKITSLAKVEPKEKVNKAMPLTEKLTKEKKKQAKPKLPLIPPEKMPENAIVQITDAGKIYWREKNTISDIPIVKQNTDLVVYQQVSHAEDKELAVFFSRGKAYPLDMDDIPAYPTKDNIDRLVSNSATQNSSEAIDYLCLNQLKSATHLILLTQGGYLKRISLQELDGLSNRGFQLIKLKGKDSLSYVVPVKEDSEIAIATNGGRVLRYGVTEGMIPTMGKAAQGNIGIKLRYGEKIVGCQAVNRKSTLCLVSELGYGKLIPIAQIRKIRMGELGTQAFRFKQKEDKLRQILLTEKAEQIIVQTNLNNRHIFELSKLSSNNSNEKQIVKLNKEESISLAIPWWGNIKEQ